MTEENLLTILSEKVLIGDGAMGTMLYQRGVFLNSCFDELNLTNPELVREIHDAYVQAGADFIETNTFGANEVKLGKFGLGDKVEQINKAAVQIARDTATGGVLVAGAIGPLGRQITEHGGLTTKQASTVFAGQAKALADAGADFLILETFSRTEELLLAAGAAHEVANLPIVAHLTVNERSETIYGEKINAAVARVAAAPGVAVVGLNCSVGPSDMLTSFELIKDVVNKPISIQPNAGLPRQVEDRMLYMCTPEYMAEYAKRFFEKGARIIGGCCVTTPEHIRQMRRAVHAMDRAATRKGGSVVTLEEPVRPKGTEQAPLAEKSKIGAALAQGRKVTTIEVTPPRGVDMGSIIDKARLCAEMGVDAINIPDGPRASSRLSPLVTAVEIQRNADIETILHFCCRDRNLIGMQSDILGASAIGLHNVLIITGDPPKLGDYPHATGVFDMDSIALTDVVRNLNCGIDIGANEFSPGTRLTVGVGANPVAVDIDREIERFKQKVEAGAEYAISQPVFDPEMLLRFLDAVASCEIPVVAGIWPFTSFKNAEFMANEVPGVVVPDNILERMATAQTRQEGRKLGIEIAQEMIHEIENRVAGFAVSAPFGNVRTALSVLGKIDIDDL